MNAFCLIKHIVKKYVQKPLNVKYFFSYNVYMLVYPLKPLLPIVEVVVEEFLTIFQNLITLQTFVSTSTRRFYPLSLCQETFI